MLATEALVAGMALAAGPSTRISRNKRLLELGDEIMIGRTAR